MRLGHINTLHLITSLNWLIQSSCADAESQCHPNHRTFSNDLPKPGNYQPWSLIKLGSVGFHAKQYVTIVNLTPHRFILDKGRTHSYQFDEFDWDDVPQGRSRQNVASYTSNTIVNHEDDNGEAYYRIEGTNKTFIVRKTTHIPHQYPRRTVFDLNGMGLGAREYFDPGKESSVTLVITGSDTYGFITSLQHGVGNWMKGLYNVIKDRQLKHIYMPGTHDAGMTTITSHLKTIGSKDNTQTQGLNLYNQLRAGARLFDLRVGTVHENDDVKRYSFHVMHVSDERANIVVGNTGESLDEVIDQTNRFTAENPGEIIIFRMRYLIGIREIPFGGPIFWTSAIMEEFTTKMKSVKNRCPNLEHDTIPFSEQPASYFMDRNEGKGCVLFLLSGRNLKDPVPRASVADGLYEDSALPVQDNWSDMPSTEEVANDQVLKWKRISRSGNFENDSFFISQWLVSANAVSTTLLSIQSIAVQPTNPALYWMGLNNMSPECFPTVSLVDYFGVAIKNSYNFSQLSADAYTFTIGMNLYMISENCGISKQRSPLLPAKRSIVSLSNEVTNMLAPQRRDVIYGNGTVSDGSGGRPGQLEILRRGTMFLNGTSLGQASKNPNF